MPPHHAAIWEAMEEYKKVASAISFLFLRSIRDVVQFQPATEFKEGMFEAWEGLLGEIPELISCCGTVSYASCMFLSDRRRTYCESQPILLRVFLEEGTALESQSKV